MSVASWSPSIDWETPAGRALRKLFGVLDPSRSYHLTLFGSSPIQLGIEPTFASADVDLFAGEWGPVYEEVSAAVKRAGLSKEQAEEDVYVQVCLQSKFKTSPLWFTRVFTTEIGNVRLTLPHPLDILIAKLHRLEDKDLRAFRLVIDRTGHPTEDERRRELQFAVDLYRPGFDKEMVGDITTNTRVLWQELWGKEINVRQEIIAPAVRRRNEGYADDIAREDYRARLRELGNE